MSSGTSNTTQTDTNTYNKCPCTLNTPPHIHTTCAFNNYFGEHVKIQRLWCTDICNLHILLPQAVECISTWCEHFETHDWRKDVKQAAGGEQRPDYYWKSETHSVFYAWKKFDFSGNVILDWDFVDSVFGWWQINCVHRHVKRMHTWKCDNATNKLSRVSPFHHPECSISRATDGNVFFFINLHLDILLTEVEHISYARVIVETIETSETSLELTLVHKICAEVNGTAVWLVTLKTLCWPHAIR